jgi:hypothetical protein
MHGWVDVRKSEYLGTWKEDNWISEWTGEWRWVDGRVKELEDRWDIRMTGDRGIESRIWMK